MKALIAEQANFRGCTRKLGEELKVLIDEIVDKYHETEEGSIPAIVVGSTVGSLGLVSLVAGICLAPFTAGISLSLPAAVALISAGSLAAVGGGTAIGIGAHKRAKAMSLSEALHALREFETMAQTVIDAFNTVNEEFGDELIEKLMQQSGLTCPICLDVVSEDCRVVYYSDEEEGNEIYCAQCIALHMASAARPISPITRKPLTEDMLVRERTLVRRVRAFRANMTGATGVVSRFKEACKVKASLRQLDPDELH